MFSSMIKVKKGEENGDWETELDCAAGRWVSVSKGTFFPQINPSFPWAKLVPNLDYYYYYHRSFLAMVVII